MFEKDEKRWTYKMKKETLWEKRIITRQKNIEVEHHGEKDILFSNTRIYQCDDWRRGRL